MSRHKDPIPYEESLRYVKRFFYVSIPILLALELFVHHHAMIGIDGTIFFNAWFGFISCAAIVIFSKGLGVLLKRRADYYDADAHAKPAEPDDTFSDPTA